MKSGYVLCNTEILQYFPLFFSNPHTVANITMARFLIQETSEVPSERLSDEQVD